MTRTRSPLARALSALAAIALTTTGLVVGTALPASAAPPALVYDSIPEPLPPSYTSLGYQATSTNEFGDAVVLAGTDRDLQSVSVGMVSWACENWASGANPCVSSEGSSFTHPITLNVYAVDRSGATAVPGALLKTVTESKSIPYRPSANAEACGDNRWSNGTSCYNGFAFTLDFALGGVTVPDEVLVTVAFNTQTRGYSPIGTAGPYNSLNVAVSPAAPTVGTDPSNSEMFLSTSSAPALAVDDDWGAYFGLVLEVSATSPVVNTSCTTIMSGPVATQNDGQQWDFAETRDNGSNTYVNGGLKVTTTSADYFGKAAGYKSIDIALKDVGDFAIDLSDVTGVAPSLQLGVDLDNDGDWDGYLVYEETYYGQNLWASNHILNHTPAFVGLPTHGGGGGAVSGTINEYLAAYPDARLTSFGYSLGSGVVGSAIIHSITVGCVEYGFTFQPPVVSSCPAITDAPVATPASLQGWDFQETRANGSNTFVDGGLAVATTSADFFGKAAGYKPIDIALKDVGDFSITLTDVTGVPPSLQLGVDLDNDGDWDGYLVYEPTYYGQNLWASSHIQSHSPAFVGLPTHGGGGSPISGTVNEYLAAYPDARLTSFGYSLGSGVVGSATITSIVVGCTDYTFDALIEPGTPTISGTPTVGETLTAVPGTWSPVDVSFSYQWKSNGSPIPGATSSTYTLTGEEAGDTVVVVVTGSKSGYTPVDAISAGVTIATGTLTTATPTIAGTPAVGATLTAHPGTWGPAPVVFQYQWLSGGVAISGATGVTYVPGFNDAGDSISVRVTGSKTGYTPVTLTSSAVVIPSGSVPDVDREAGADRYATAVAVSKNFDAGVSRVYLATGTNYPDALSAAAAAGYLGVPVLLATPTAVPAIVMTELTRLSPEEIVIVGSTAAISAEVEVQLSTLAFDPDILRIGGVDRWETSREIAQEAFPAGSTHTAYIATGLNFPDALAAGPAAAHFDGPVILVNGTANTVGSATLALLSSLGVDDVKIAGSTAVVSAAIQSQLAGSYSVERNQGPNRFETAVAINEDAFDSAPTVFLATGLNFPDALAGAALAGSLDAPLYVTVTECIPPAVYASIVKMNPSKIVLLGGTPALGTGVANLVKC